MVRNFDAGIHRKNNSPNTILQIQNDHYMQHTHEHPIRMENRLKTQSQSKIHRQQDKRELLTSKKLSKESYIMHAR